MHAAPAQRWYSVADLSVMLGCGRSTAYRIVKEMEAEGYLRKVFLGKCDLRISAESVEIWERRHERPAGACSLADVVRLREQRTAPRQKPAVSGGAVSIRELWKKAKAA